MATPDNFPRRASAPARAEEVARPRLLATVLTSARALNEVYYFIELFEEAEKSRTYFLRTYSDITTLDEALRDSLGNRGGKMVYGKSGKIKEIAELPQAERFGFRRRLSQMGLSDYQTERQKQIQGYLNATMAQVASVSEEPLINEFFPEGVPLKTNTNHSEQEKSALRILCEGLISDFSARTPEECEATVYENGTAIRVVGLHNTQEYNNVTGVVMLQTGGSYKIRMSDGRAAKVKAVNVRLFVPEKTDTQLLLEAQAKQAERSALPGGPRRSSFAQLLGLADADEPS